jgi:aminopeptidase N
VYGKGAVMYDALRKQIGDEKFFAFLQRYYQQHEFGRVDGQEWEKTLAEVIGAGRRVLPEMGRRHQHHAR